MRDHAAPDLLGFDRVLAEERAALGVGQEPISALCLSGGGIRSAAFALGVLQALARFGLLGQFHYFSTVSGGGYIGSWLSAWRSRLGADDDALMDRLGRRARPDGQEPAELRWLRANSNYLTPKLGVLSADTWTVVALCARNLLLNWAMFGPLFLGLLFVPRLCGLALAVVQADTAAWPRDARIAAAIGLAAALAGLSAASRGRLQASGKWLTEARFMVRVLAPLVITAAAGAVVAATRPPLGPEATIWLDGPTRLWLAGLVAVYGVAWAVTVSRLTRDEARALNYWLDGLSWLVAGLVCACLLGAGIWLVERFEPSPTALVPLVITWMMLSQAIGNMVFAAASSWSRRGDADREWIARCDGWLLATAFTWTIGSAVVLYGVPLVQLGWPTFSAWLAGLGVSGVVTLVLGGGGGTAATSVTQVARRAPPALLISVAALIFAVALGIGLSWVDLRILVFIGGRVGPNHNLAMLAVGTVIAIVLVLVALLVSYFVNVNRFSLHAVYRNRLVRTFLGAVRPDRRPDPFSQFDRADNPTMAGMCWRAPQRPARLLHVVNMALNVLHTDNLAWQERRAESFTVTPLHAGNTHVQYRRTQLYGDPHGGMTLGTAMAISGAAVSPNMGYHSSPLVSVLLMLFNLRLGWWLGNPRAAARVWRSDGPIPALLPSLMELAGQTSDNAKWIYLSDGGHFDNLGLYAMI